MGGSGTKQSGVYKAPKAKDIVVVLVGPSMMESEKSF
jgi:hypothetical protein